MMNKISKKANIGKNVTIGDYTIIHDNVIIGDNTTIETHSIIGYPSSGAENLPTIIGDNSYIRSHNVIYEGAQFGDDLVTGHYVLVREKSICGTGIQIGTKSELQGYCKLGDYVKMHSEVHIAKESVIGDFAFLFPKVQFTNDPFPPSTIVEGITLKEMAVVATGSILLPGITIGKGGIVAAGSVVKQDVPDLMCVAGNPSKIICRIDQVRSFKYNLQYPWGKYFRNIYPEKSFPLLDKYTNEILLLIDKVKLNKLSKK